MLISELHRHFRNQLARTFIEKSRLARKEVLEERLQGGRELELRKKMRRQARAMAQAVKSSCENSIAELKARARTVASKTNRMRVGCANTVRPVRGCCLTFRLSRKWSTIVSIPRSGTLLAARLAKPLPFLPLTVEPKSLVRCACFLAHVYLLGKPIGS